MTSAVISSPSITPGITCVRWGVMYIPNVFSAPITSSIAKNITPNKRNIQAFRGFCPAFLSIVKAMNAAITARNPADSCAIPYTQSYVVKMSFTSSVRFFGLLVFKCYCIFLRMHELMGYINSMSSPAIRI